MTSTDTLQFFDLSHPWGHGVPNWPYFEDVKIERVHYHAKSRVLTQRITTVMHCTTHLDAPGHVIEGAPLIEDLPLSLFFGTGVVVSIPKGKWEKIMPEDLEAARPEILPGDIVIVNTGWHHTFGDNSTYYAYSPGFYREAGEWFVERGVRRSARIRRPWTTRWPPRSRRTAPVPPTVCCRGRARNTRRRPDGPFLTTFPSGNRATGRFWLTASWVSRTSAATWTP